MEDMLIRAWEYILKAFSGLKPIFGGLLGALYYICFPDRAYFLALMAVLAAAMADIFTKIYSIIKVNGGYKKAVETGKLFSKQLWKGTEVKIVSYLTVMILTGLSYRVIYLKEASILIASFVYSVMFMREFQSNIENLCAAGADLHWLLLFAKKKNKDLMKEVESKEEAEKVGGFDGRV